MTWVKLDDGFSEHPKVEALSAEALRLHIFALCYCNRNLTDGFLAETRPALLVPKFRPWMTAELVRSTLWDRCEQGGWQIHDYLQFNPSRADVLAQRAVKAEAGRKGGVKSGEARRQANGKQRASVLVEPPSRPDPKGLGTESVLTVSGGEGAPSGASPCPKCEDMGWIETEAGAQPCPHTYLQAVST